MRAVSSSFAHWATGVVSLAFVIIFSMTFFYERRQRRWYRLIENQPSFYCNRCGHIFSKPLDEADCVCPRCTDHCDLVKL